MMRGRFTSPAPTTAGESHVPAVTMRQASNWLAPVNGFAVSQAVLPFMLPSLDHLNDEVDRVVKQATDVEGLQLSTTKRWRVAYRSFRTYLDASSAADRFLSGDARIQQGLLEGWIAWLRQRQRSRNAIATYWRGAAALVGRMAAASNQFNPFLLVPAPKENLPQPRYLTREAAERLIRHLQNTQWQSRLEGTRNVCLFGLLLLAGLRRQEVLRLTVSDVNLENGTLRIRSGKGRNGGRDRTAYMTPQLRHLIDDYLQQRDQARRTHPELLTSVAADQAFAVTALRRLFRRVAKALGIRLTPHMLRHTYATLLRQAGVPDRVAMDLLGHKSLAMLQRYSHVVDGEHADQASRLRLEINL